MRIRKTATRSVHPVVAAIAIVVVLAVVQYVWWMKLVAKPRVVARGGAPAARGAPPPEAIEVGPKSVLVDTIAGEPDPGGSDGIGRDARFDGPAGIALDRSGSIWVADSRNHRIRLISPQRRTSTVTGSTSGFRDGDVQTALFSAPSGIAVAPDGAVFIADTGNHRIRRIAGGQVTTIAGSVEGLADGDGRSARFNRPAALAWQDERLGRLLIADCGNRRIRLIQTMGARPMVSTVADCREVSTSVAARGGALAFTIPGAGIFNIAGRPLSHITISRTPESSLPPNYVKSILPCAIAGDADGWLLADARQGALLRLNGNQLEVVAGMCMSKSITFGFHDGTGENSRFGIISSIASDGKGHIYVADGTNNAIRKITLPSSSSSAQVSPGAGTGF